MNAPHAASVDQLRHESERTRQELSDTVTELRDKVGDAATEFKTLVSPSHIKQELKNYIREERESISRSFQRKIRDNPLQAAAVGAALAYPALGILRAIPAPILLIGAGLWLSGAGGKKALEQARSAVADAAGLGTAKLSEIAEPLQASVADGKRKIADGTEKLKEGLQQASTTVATSATALAQMSRDAANDVRDSVAATVASVADVAVANAEAATGAVSDATHGAVELGSRARNAVHEFADRNPLLLAGVGVAVGALIAASLPASDTETRLFAKTSEGLKDKAREFAVQGLEKARTMVADAADDIATAAARQGLGEDGVKSATGTVIDGVRAVADRGMKAAFDQEKASRPAPQSYQHI